MTFTFYHRKPARQDQGTSWPGPPRPDEIYFTCEADNLEEARKIFRAFLRLTDRMIKCEPWSLQAFKGEYTDNEHTFLA